MSFPKDHNDESARDMHLMRCSLEERIRGCVGDSCGKSQARLRNANAIRSTLVRMLAIVDGWIGE